jgi:hypothetical protein
MEIGQFRPNPGIYQANHKEAISWRSLGVVVLGGFFCSFQCKIDKVQARVKEYLKKRGCYVELS